MSENGMSAADVAAVVGANRDGFDGFGGNGAWWLVVLFLFAMNNGGGWLNGGNGNLVTQSELQAGLNQQTLQNNQNNLLQQLNNNRSELQNQLSTMLMAQQQGFCDNKQAVLDALREVLTANTAGTQRILDQLCQDKIDQKDEIIANLRTQLNMQALSASQTAQTAQLMADNAAQTTALEQYLNPTPIPAYVVQNPNCCSNQWNGCGCNSFATA